MDNTIRTLIALACLVGPSGAAGAMPPFQEAQEPQGQAAPLPPNGYSTPAQMLLELRKLESQASRMILQEIGFSPSGQPLVVATWPSDSAAKDGPEVLIVANLEGDRPVASEVAMGLVRRVAAQGSPLLRVATLHVLPVANPDGATHALDGVGPWRGPAVDDDRDGSSDEDGPSDLDGDGRVLWMRVPSSSGTFHASETDARISVKAKDVREVPAAFDLRREGRDADGDRLFGEDGLGGIEVDRNFAHRWKQYAPEAGPYPLSEPESRALADFMIRHPRIAWLLVLDDEDNLADAPSGIDEMKIDSTEPLKADAAVLGVLGKRLKPEEVDESPLAPEDYRLEDLIAAAKENSNLSSVEVRTEVKPEEELPKWTAPRSADHGPGNFADWAYYQRGVFVLESAVWSPPLDFVPEGSEELPKEATDEERFLRWADHTYGSACFHDWTPFRDEQMGMVEIGGMLPLIQANPPATELADLTARYASFVDSLAEDFARIEWSEVTYKPLDDRGVYEVRAKLVNRGRLATTSDMGVKNRVPLPIRITMELPEGGEILVGRAQSSVAQLHGFGGFEEFHWIVRVPRKGEGPVLNARSNTAGTARLPLEVK
ncbi:MAG: hypothetical protein KDB61_03915 [Planctomycetes bacterium]|nr:hypothetical protein [Planctomycetota bacterium]